MRLLFLLFLIFSCNLLIAQKNWSIVEEDSLKNARLLSEEGNYELAFPIFENLYKKHAGDFFLKYVYGNCALNMSGKRDIALTLLTEVYLKNKKAGDITLDLARALHYNCKFDSANYFIDLYLAQKNLSPEKKKLAEQTKRYIANASYFYAHPTETKISNAGNNVNSENDEYVPVLAADEAKIIFTYKGRGSKGGRQNAFQEKDSSGKYYEDVFISTRKNNSWVKPWGISTINTNIHEAAIAISPDGTRLFTYRNEGYDNGDIYVSSLDGLEWSTPVKLKGQINSPSWEGSCSLTSDGQTLFFSSERPGGFGARDIYKASLMADSTWGHIVNLGDSINTKYDDDAPFIHADGITLFFSSKGRNSMGDYDVFQSALNPLDSTFGSPVNLGYPINTTGGDRYYVVTADGQTGYYSSEKTGGFGLNDIYSVDPGYIGKKPTIYLVKGKVTLDGVPVDSKILVKIASKNNKLFSTVIPNKITGEYLITLPTGDVFKLVYMHNNFEWKIIEIDASGIKNFVEKKYDIDLNPNFIQHSSDTNAIKDDKSGKTDSLEVKSNSLARTLKFAEKYGQISADSLGFKVQIAAYRHNENYSYKHLNGFGKVESLELSDGITRITIGGNFETIGQAYSLCKRVLQAGQSDAFVTAIYKGKRVYLEQLEVMGIFK